MPILIFSLFIMIVCGSITYDKKVKDNNPPYVKSIPTPEVME